MVMIIFLATLGIVLYLISCSVVVNSAADRECDATSVFMICLLFSPLIGYLHVMCQKRKSDREAEERIMRLLEAAITNKLLNQ